MNYCSRDTHESTTTPGVKFTIHKMNERRRIRRELTIAPLREKVNEQAKALKAAIDDPESPAGTADRLNREFGDFLASQWYPAWIRWGLHSIEGFQINGVNATVEMICGEDAPTELVEEIQQAIFKAAGFTAVEEKNSELPTSLDSQADGKTSNTTATSVEMPDGGKNEIAQSTSPAT